MNRIDISVIMPVYNNGNVLKRTIESFLNQDFKGTSELICAIDPSSDNSLEIANSYALKDSRVKVLPFKEKVGLGESRKKGLLASKGKYICFLDADDELRPNFLSTFHSLMSEGDSDVATCCFSIYKGKRHLKFPFSKNKKMDKKQAMKAYYMDSFMRGFFWNKCYRREILMDADFLASMPIFNFFEDHAANSIAISKADKVISTSKSLYNYHKDNEASQTSKKMTDKAYKELMGFMFERLYFETREDSVSLKAMKGKRWRIILLIGLDVIKDKFGGAPKGYLKKMIRMWKAFSDFSKPLQSQGGEFSEELKGYFSKLDEIR